MLLPVLFPNCGCLTASGAIQEIIYSYNSADKFDSTFWTIQLLSFPMVSPQWETSTSLLCYSSSARPDHNDCPTVTVPQLARSNSARKEFEH